MKNPAQIYPSFAGLCILVLLPVLPVLAELPKRDLTIELRQVEQGDSSGRSVGTRWRVPLLVEQHVRVRNGEKANVSLGGSIPMQWMQSAAGQSTTLAASGTSLSSSGGAVTNALTWVDVGQSIKLHARWAGGAQPVVVDVEMQAAGVGDRTGTEVQNQSRSQVATTVSAPLDQWVTIAATGSTPQRGVYGSDANSNARLLLQIRVLAP